MSEYPTNPSNRHVIRQMELWGFTRVERFGDYERWLNPDGTNSVHVVAPHIKRKNTVELLSKVYQEAAAFALTIDPDRYRDKLNIEVFWMGPPPVVGFIAAMTGEEPEDTGERRCQDCGESYNIEDFGGSENNGRCIRCGVEYETTEEVDIPAMRRNRGLAMRILAKMQADPDPSRVFTASDVSDLTNIRQSAHSAFSTLVKRGLVVRVINGGYRLAPQLAAGEVVHHHHDGPVRHEFTTAPETPAVKLIAPPPLDDDSNIADELLELLLPDDYQFKVSHLPAMARWRDETVKLLGVLSC